VPRKPPVLTGIAAGIAVFQVAGRWWLMTRGPSGHMGALVLGTGFLALSLFLGVCGILCGVAALLRRERYWPLSVAVILVLLFELRILLTYR
jgi:hypothetical protein